MDPSLPVFPIAVYDSLWVSQIVPLIAELDLDELATVEARERGGRHRAAVLDAVADARPTATTPTRSSPGVRAEPEAEPEAKPEPEPELEVEVDEANVEVEVEVEAEVEVEGHHRAGRAPVDDLGVEASDHPPVTADHGPANVIVAPTVPATEAEDDLWMVDDRDPFDRTGAEAGVRVRTFLGRRRSPMTVRCG